MKRIIVKAEFPILEGKTPYESFLYTIATWTGEYKHTWKELNNMKETTAALGDWVLHEAFDRPASGFYKCAWIEVGEEGWMTDCFVVDGNTIRHDSVEEISDDDEEVKIEAEYAPTSDTTFLVEYTYVGGELKSREVISFYSGEPNDQNNKLYSTDAKGIKAEYKL